MTTLDPNDAKLEALFGKPVPGGEAPALTSSITLQGKHATLSPITQEDLPDLFTNLGLPENQALVAYLQAPPDAFSTPDNFWQTITSLATNRNFEIFVIKADPKRLGPSATPSPADKPSHDQALGLIAYLDIQPMNRAVEIGLVIFGPQLQRTVAATEAHYLLLCHAFGSDRYALQPPYRRVVWKCNSLNRASRRAADRLGFVFEGTLRNHMISRERSRDSDFLSITGDEWPPIKAGLELWMREENFGMDGSQIENLDACRERARTSREEN